MSATLSEAKPAQTYTSSPGEPQPLLSDQDLATWRKRIRQSLNDRRRLEPGWQMNLAFAAGKQHLVWKPFAKGGRFILPELAPGRHRVTVDKIADLRMTVLGQLSMDDDRPQLLFRRDDLPTEDFAETANDALAAGWETEWLGDPVLQDVKRTMIDVGTAAARCLFDPSAGPTRAKQVPHRDGKPVLSVTDAQAYVADQHASGRSADLRSIHEGRIRWDAGTPFNILVPPGVKREGSFPWEGWMAPVHVDKVREEYGQTLKAEAIDDLNSQGDSATAVGDGEDAPTGLAKLDDHVFVYTIYQRPCRDWPDGRVMVFAGASLKCLEVRNQLPYMAPDGTRRSGVHYFHYIRLADRFWSRSLVDLAKGPQRLFNHRRSQISEHLDRGQAFIIAQENSLPKRSGVPVEVIPMKPGAPAPQVEAGVPIGAWVWQELQQLEDDLRKATGLQDVLQGQNPQNVGNYSQLALLQEQASRSFDVIGASFKETVGHLVEDSVSAIRQYWGPDKQLALQGPDGELKAFAFDATRVPDFYRVYVAKGAAIPRSQAGELKKVDDLAAYSINSGQPLPLAWVAESYDAGKPVELPETDRHDQLDKAMFENQQLEQGRLPVVAYYDDHALHVTVHRSVQARADAAGNQQLSALCEKHIEAHEQQAEQNAAQTPGQPPLPGAPGAAAAAGQQDLGIPHPSPFSLFLRQGSQGPGNFGL